MNLTEFLLDNKLQPTVEKTSVICFQADVYPLLFCRQLMMYCARLGSRAVINSSMGAENHTVTMASLQTTFLGNESWYWLGSDVELSKKVSDAWHEYLAEYTGPNKLFFFTTKSVKTTKSCMVIKLPAMVDYKLFLTLSTMIGNPLKPFADQIYRFHKEIPLEMAVLFTKYGSLVGKNGSHFVEEWLHKLLVPVSSLFSLSQALFAKQSRSFLRQWKQMGPTYGASFWVVFWAEQFWQAYAYVRLHKSGKSLEANRIGYRLPFSFKNRDWRSHSLHALRQAHHQLYEIDFHLKNGGSNVALELFFMNVLQGNG
jgi:hypothetical protein